MAISSGSTGVAHQSSQYRYMLEDWLLIDAIRGGTRTMRMAGSAYMPQRTAETSTDYAIRLQNATLYPAFIETSSSMTGRVFAQPITINDDVPQWIKDEVLPDCDRQGRNLHAFVREWFQEALDFGMSHVLVDSPPIDPTVVMSKEDQQKAGIRPYYIKVRPRNVLGWREVGGKLTQLRVQFSTEQTEGDWAALTVDEIRIYDLVDGKVQVTVWQEMKDPQAPSNPNEKPTPRYQDTETYIMDIDEIPFVTLYTKRTGFMMAEPPLRELAFLNAKHWRFESELDILIETAMVPILATIGVSNTQALVVGAKQFVKLPSGGDMKYVEHTGSSIQSGERKLAAIVEQMRQAGAALLKPIVQRTGRTQVEVSDEVARDQSALGAMVMTLQDTLARVLQLTAKWRGEKDGGSVTVNPNLDPEANPGNVVDALDKCIDNGVLSRQTAFETVKTTGLIHESREWDGPDGEVERIKADAKFTADTVGLLGSPPVLPGATGPADPKPGATGATGPAK